MPPVQECMREERGYNGLQKMQVALPERNDCPWIHCSLIVQGEREARSAREFKVKQKTEERTEWQAQSESQRGGEEKCQTCW